MQITDRLLNVKRHTLGFAVDGQHYTRAQTIKLAKQKLISGVRVCKGLRGPYLTSTTSQSLYSLPTVIMVGRIRSSARSSGVAAKTATVARKTNTQTSRSRTTH